MTKRIFFLAVFCSLALVACAENGFVKYYHDRTGGVGLTKAPVILPTGDPKVLTGGDPNADALSMLEEGYLLLGISSFRGPSVNINDALVQAKKVKAEVVFVYAKHAGTPTDATTTLVYSIERYRYFAEYSIKQKPRPLGVYVKDLSSELRQQIGSNKGATIYVVVKNSAAFRNDILKGDVIKESKRRRNIGPWQLSTNYKAVGRTKSRN